MPDRPPPVSEDEFTESYLKGSGPGGQKIVSQSHEVTGLVLLPVWAIETNVKCRSLREVEQNKTSSAVQLKHIPTGLVLKVQTTRSRSQNRKIARQMLAEKLEVLEKGKHSRVAIVGEAKQKKKSSAVKKSKRKYRLLEEEKSKAAKGAAREESSGQHENKGLD
jgi:peptide chain release factor